jgi:DNA-binding SARP family transcriptional activator/tetratricopeptide (TPR) repeat protein
VYRWFTTSLLSGGPGRSKGWAVRTAWGLGCGMEIRLLGPVEVSAGGRVLAAGQPQQRLVLAAVAVDVPRPVPASTVVDRVWAQDPPAQARTAVAARVTHLRHLLADAAATEASESRPAGPSSDGQAARADWPDRAGSQERWLAWVSGGYLLRVDSDQVDLLRFRRLAAEARRGERSDAERVGLLDEALGLWRGVALEGLRGEWASRMRDSWGMERVEAVLEWGRAALRLGHYARVIPVVRDLVEQHPYNEALAVVLVWALAADGRRDEAAEHCTSICHRLATELGADPGPALRKLQQAVLGDQPLPALSPPPRPAATPPAVPAQLPGDVPGFAGRAAHLARLDTVLGTAAVQAPTAVVITAVSGTAGVGKTALAVHWAHRVRCRFPDGQLYVNLRGFDPGGQVMQPATAVRGFLDALGLPAERIPADLDAQAALYRSLLAGRRMLVVLDNARDADHVRPLLPGTATALAVVTSRNELTPLVAADGAHPLSLDLLSTEEARELLARCVDPGRIAAQPQAVEEIITACARLPLALALVAARAATHPTFGLAALATELAAVGGRTGRLDGGDVLAQVRAVFSWSYSALTPPAARLFRLLGLHPGPDTTAPAAASLTAASLADTRGSLAELTRAGLLTEHAPGRYGFHDLLRAYATDLTQTIDPDEERRTATTRLLDHYTHTAHTAARLLNPVRDPIRIPVAPPAPNTTPEQPTDQRAALAWLTAEHPVLLAAQRLAAGTGFDTHTWQLAWALDTFLDRRGHWHDQVSAWQTALAAADRLGNLTATAFAHRALALAGSSLGGYGEAHTHLRRALDPSTEAGDLVGQAHTHLHLGGLWERQDRPDRALDHGQQALILFRATGHRRGQAGALNNLGWYHALLGDHAQAVTYCRQALTLFQQLGDRVGEAAACDSLGYAHHHLGHHTRAVDCYQQALTGYRDLGDRYQEATTLTHLGDTHLAADQPDAARAAWTDALGILTDLDHPDAEAVHARLATLDQTSP